MNPLHAVLDSRFTDILSRNFQLHQADFVEFTKEAGATREEVR